MTVWPFAGATGLIHRMPKNSQVRHLPQAPVMQALCTLEMILHKQNMAIAHCDLFTTCSVSLYKSSINPNQGREPHILTSILLSVFDIFALHLFR